MRRFIFLLFVFMLPMALSAQSHRITRKSSSETKTNQRKPQVVENTVKKTVPKLEVTDRTLSNKKLTEFDKQHELARMGDSEAQRYVGYCYQYGKGVKQNAENAFYWYNKAAQNGNHEA